MLDFLRVKTVPTVSWSSPRPLNFFPALRTFVLLCIGLVLFGVGEALLINAGVGVSPWTVFSQGVANTSGLGIGMSTFFIGVGVLVLWIPLRQTPGLGTLLNIIIIAAVMELSLPYLPQMAGTVSGIIQTMLGVFIVGLGSGLYLVANLGPGPRDGVMTGFAARNRVACCAGADEHRANSGRYRLVTGGRCGTWDAVVRRVYWPSSVHRPLSCG